MRVPKESLEDFCAVAEERQAPPRMVSPRLSGETEMLKPLTRWEDLVRARAASRRRYLWMGFWQLSGFHRSLAIGGACSVIVFVLGLGLYLGFYGQPVGQEADQLLASQQKARSIRPPKARNPFDHAPTTRSTAMSDEPVVVPAVEYRPAVSRARATRAVYRSRRIIRAPRLAMTKFIPTTLIIYVEKGQVKSRIEPQLTASYRKPITSPN